MRISEEDTNGQKGTDFRSDVHFDGGTCHHQRIRVERRLEKLTSPLSFWYASLSRLSSTLRLVSSSLGGPLDVEADSVMLTFV